MKNTLFRRNNQLFQITKERTPKGCEIKQRYAIISATAIVKAMITTFFT